jgi:23S rRNA (uracil1939-C5)-methyltransferase
MRATGRSAEPWWVTRARALLEAPERRSVAGSADELGQLWRRSSEFAFVHENVTPELLAIDVQAHPELAQLWSDFLVGETNASFALSTHRDAETARLRGGGLEPEGFHGRWRALGFDETQDRANPPADEYLEGLFSIPRLAVGEERPPFAQVNMASRAERIEDFLMTMHPREGDVVYDLGSGSGKFAVTVAASTRAQVRGVELGASYVEAARRAAASLGCTRVEFICLDARKVDVSDGTHFYLFHPFWGEVARDLAARLGALARMKRIDIYAAGPEFGFGQYFLEQVQANALTLVERRGAQREVLVLRSR